MNRQASGLLRRCNDSLTPPALGALATAGFAPYNYYGLILLALAGLVALWWDAGWARAAWRGWLFGLGYFGSGIYWVFISTSVYGGAPVIVAIFLVALLTAVLALYIALAGALAGAMKGLPDALWALLCLPAAWLLGELGRATIGTGFPWLSAGYALTNAPVTALAPLVGVYGLGALLVAAAGALILLLRGAVPAKAWGLALIAGIALLLWALPPVLHWTRPAGAPLAIAILQGNVAQDTKWQPDSLGPTKAKYRRLSDSVDARLVVWPEAAVAGLYEAERDYMTAAHEAALARGRTELVGVLVYERAGDDFYNAMFAQGVDDGRYYKRHLVPFGEYFPIPDFLRPLLDGVNMRFSSFTHGPEDQALIEVEGIALGLSVCFEDAFPREIRKALPAAGILVNVTNDAWFADSTAPHQHLQIARMRALEAGRPLLRAANTGISAIIAADGRIEKRTPQFQVATLEASVQPRAGATPYVRMGNMPLWIFALGVCGLGLAAARLRNRA